MRTSDECHLTGRTSNAPALGAERGRRNRGRNESSARYAIGTQVFMLGLGRNLTAEKMGLGSARCQFV